MKTELSLKWIVLNLNDHLQLSNPIFWSVEKTKQNHEQLSLLQLLNQVALS